MPPSPRLHFVQPRPLALTHSATHTLRRTCPKSCTEQYAQVRRLSLPTTRERAYLKNIRVRRAEGRCLQQTRTRCFSLKAWPLVVTAPGGAQSTSEASHLCAEYVDASSVDTDEGFTDASILPDEDVLQQVPFDPSSVSNPSPAANCHAQIPHTTNLSTFPHPDRNSDLLPVPQTSTNVHCPSTVQLQIPEDANARNHTNFRLPTEPLPKIFLSSVQRWNPESNDTHIRTVPAWAYTVIIRAKKSTIGKRSVLRNRAKRRIRAAVAQIFPRHASRQVEYVFTANPESLIICFEELVKEVSDALEAIHCWKDNLTIDMIRREKYCER